MIEFSVLISVYYKDNPIFFREALNSIYFGQSVKPSEVVIVKDGLLTSDLDSVISEFSSVVPCNIVEINENVGLGEALNIGLKNCSYEYVARMDSDDISHPERFLRQINFLNNNPSIDVLGSYIFEFLDNIQNIISIRKVPLSHSECIKFLKYGCPLNHPSVVFKKSVIFQSGNYQPFFLKEDLFLWLRVYENGFNFFNLEESLVYFRISPDMYKRRRGFRYSLSEFKLFYFRYKIKLINFFEFLFYGSFIFLLRLLPGPLLKCFYKKIVRKIY